MEQDVYVGGIKVEFKKLRPPEECPEYKGFQPETRILPAGYQYQEGRRRFPTDTIFQRDVAVKMRDGVVIYCDIFRPVDTQGEKIPAIVCWGTAGKGGMNNMLDHITEGSVFGMETDPEVKPRLGIPMDATSGMQAWECPDPAYWVQYGYAVINADPRGVFNSEGDIQYFGPVDGADIYDFVEAVAQMDWCSGKVATAGCSWYAMVQLYSASVRAPHLACIAPLEGHGDLYHEEYVKGGIPIDTSMPNERSFGHGRIENLYAMVDKCPLFNDYWESKRADVGRIDLPVYMVGSFTGHIHAHGALEAFHGIASEKKWMRIHKTQEWVDLWDDTKQDDLRRFFDHYLKGIENGWEDTARFRYSVLDFEGEAEENVPSQCFPPKGLKTRQYFLDASSGTMQPGSVAHTASVSYDSEAGGRLEFRLKVTREMLTIGYFAVKLWVSAETADDMDLFVRVTQISADGSIPYHDARFYKYTGPDGRLRVSHRRLDGEKSTFERPYHDHRTQEKLQQGQIVPVEIELWPTSMRWHEGQTLLLTVAGFDDCPYPPGDRPRCRPDNHGMHTVYTGGTYDSYLLIPEVEP